MCLTLAGALAFGVPSQVDSRTVQEPQYCQVLKDEHVDARNLSNKLYDLSKKLFEIRLKTIDTGQNYDRVTKEKRIKAKEETTQALNEIVANLDYVVILSDLNSWTDSFKDNIDHEVDKAFDCLKDDDFLGASNRVFFLEVDIKNYFNRLVKDGQCKKDKTLR